MILPHAIFFIALFFNTALSVRFFMPLIPRTASQWIIDAILLIIYGALALSLSDPLWFPFLATCLFIVATAKYVLLLGTIPYPQTLTRKILIDLLGTVACAAAWGTALLGYPLESAWALATIFAFANLYLLFINPMYRLYD